MKLVYFAYGSNMSTARLEERVGPVECMGVGTLSGHVLRFHKFSKIDQTGKCDAFYTGGAHDRVVGALFALSPDQKPVLDKYEGLGKGYNEICVVITRGCVNIDAITYVADTSAIQPALLPTRAYRQFVLDGAMEHGLPEDYVQSFISSMAVTD